MNWAKKLSRNVTAVFVVIIVLVSMFAFSLIDNLRAFADPSLSLSISANQGDQLVRRSGTGTAGGPALPTFVAGATVMLDDDFDRAESSEVGEGWVEVEGKGASVAIADHRLLFADTSDVVNRPLARRSFTEVSTGTLQWDFDFDWTRTGDESIYRVLMQLGDGGEMDDDSQDDGVGVNLVWSVIDGEHQTLGYGDGGDTSALTVLSGPAHISVVADLDTHTYSVWVDGALVKSGIPFDAEVPLNTVRYFTDQLNEDKFSGRTFDNVVIISESGGNNPPLADAGPDQGVGVGATVNLDGAGSTDADSDTLSYSWTLLTRPASSTASLTGADTASPSFVADLAGIYEVELVVSDGTDFSAPDMVSIAAGVTILLRDSFDRAESSEVGEGWVEVERKGASVAIAGHRLFFADTPDVVNRPLARRSFTEVSTGTLQWDYDFD
ncbi:MAG TPA: PKD domain-containing protein, partial [Dehalococcoidia bacterium]|nr:PKD domain-containing protein [Dehalococcoidia bacterium]